MKLHHALPYVGVPSYGRCSHGHFFRADQPGYVFTVQQGVLTFLTVPNVHGNLVAHGAYTGFILGIYTLTNSGQPYGTVHSTCI